MAKQISNSANSLCSDGQSFSLYWPLSEDAPRTSRELVDDAVREALAVPRRVAEEARQVAEVQRRVEMLARIGMGDAHEPGTVLRWRREFGVEDRAKTYTYAAIKVSNGDWYVTGNQMGHMGGWGWEKLVEWMVTGESVVEGLEIATAWEAIL